MKRRESVRPPTRKALRDASKLARRHHSAGGRVLSEASAAKREGVRRRSTKGTANEVHLDSFRIKSVDLRSAAYLVCAGMGVVLVAVLVAVGMCLCKWLTIKVF